MNSAPVGQADTELQTWLSGCARGHHPSLKKLYQRTSANLFAVALRILNDRQQAEDCLQQGYLKIWQNAGRYDYSKARPMTWMNTIIRNQALDMLRRRRVVEVSDSDEQAPELLDESPSQEEQVFRMQRGGQIHHCLETLSAQQRQCIELAYFEGMTHQELSEQLSTPLGSVKTWIRRGLLRLKECLNI